MLSQIDDTTNYRKLRLFTFACCRRCWDQLGEDSQTAIDVAEQFVEEKVGEAELLDAWRNTDYYLPHPFDDSGFVGYRRGFIGRGASLSYAAWVAGRASDIAWSSARKDDASLIARCAAASRAYSGIERIGGKRSEWRRFEAEELAAQADLLRDILGTRLFRLTNFPTTWRTSTVVALASQMYESRDFGAMPILADALQDAGCDSADVLDHCRGEGPHVRGCWVVDLVLGKE
ncbi:hypothetical protein [Gemmata massiliana]|nr:hypothetical protein [Gemmata massiliana]